MNETTERVLRSTVQHLQIRIDQSHADFTESLAQANRAADERDGLIGQRDDILATLANAAHDADQGTRTNGPGVDEHGRADSAGVE